MPSLKGYRYVPLCLAVLLVLLAVILSRQKEVMDGVGYATDRAYVDLAISRGLLKEGCYCIARGTPAPMTIDVAWRYGLAAMSWLIGNHKLSPVVLGSFCAIFTLLALLRMARELKPSLVMVCAAGLLLALSPGFTLAALSGTSQAMATLLAVLACLIHVRALAADRSPLPTLAALCVGLAACIRIEFLLLWVVFSLHALALPFAYYRQRGGFAYTLLKCVSGLVVMAICLAPLIGWNMKIIGVPWPRVLGAPLSLDALSSGAAASYGSLVAEAIKPAYASVFGASLLQALWARLLLAVGLVAIVVAAIRFRPMRGFAVFPLMAVLMPLLLACVQPVLGSAGLLVAGQALQPLWMLVAAYGLHVIAAGGEFALRKGGVARPLALRSVFAVPALLALCMAGLELSKAVADDLAVREQRQAAYGKVSQVLRSGVLKLGAVATDEPGWPAYIANLDVIDLHGEVSPFVLVHVGEDGRPDFPALAGYLREQKASALFLWTDAFAPLRQHTACEEPFPQEFLKDRPRPSICRFHWHAGP
jgi:hypothetical protein